MMGPGLYQSLFKWDRPCGAGNGCGKGQAEGKGSS